MTKRRISKATANKLSKSKVARAAPEKDSAAIANVHAETTPVSEKASVRHREETLSTESKGERGAHGDAAHELASQDRSTRKALAKHPPQLGRSGRKAVAKVAATGPSIVHCKISDEESPGQRETNPSSLAERVHEPSKLRGEAACKARGQTPYEVEGLSEDLLPNHERKAAQSCELYEHQKKVLEAVRSFDRSLGAASQGALVFNRRIIDITARNVTGGLEHAMKVARAKNLAEAMELHGAYWHKQFDELTCQIEEIRAVLTKVAADMAKITTNK